MDSIFFSENDAKAKAEEIKKACLVNGIWVEYSEIYKNGGVLDSLELKLSIKVKDVKKERPGG